MKPRLAIFVILIILACIVGINCKGKKKAPVVGPIQGPDTVNENGTASYTIAVKNADSVHYDWTVDPITVGQVMPQGAAASFTPDHVIADTLATIKVNVTVGSGDPELRLKQITILDNAKCSPDIIGPITEITNCPTTEVTDSDITLQIAASDNCTMAKDLVIVWEIYKDSELQSNGEEANMTELPVEGLSGGSWEVRVWARDESGNENQTPAVCAFEVGQKDAPPNTSITSGCQDYPSGTTQVVFVVKGTDDITPVADLTFEWDLLKNGNPEIDWTASASTSITVPGLENDNAYQFHVRAIDGKGQADPSPATCTFNITPNNPPDTIITSDCVNLPTDTTQVDFDFTGTDDITPVADLTYEWQLYTNGSLTTDWTAVSGTGVTVYGLANGKSYEFNVRAVDGGGAKDPTPAQCTFTVTNDPCANDTIPPDTQITSGCHDYPSGTASIMLGVSGTDNCTSFSNMAFEWQSYSNYSILVQPWTMAYANPISVFPLYSGHWQIYVRAVDEKNNKDNSPALCEFNIG